MSTQGRNFSIRPASSTPKASAESLLNLAEKHLNIRDNAGAGLLIHQALEIDPRNIRGLAYGGLLAANAGQKDRALKMVLKAMKLGPENPIVLKNAASVFSQCGQPRRAQGLYERLVELQPRSAWAHWNLGSHHFLQNDLSAAEMYYRKALELDPKDQRVYRDLGNLLKNSGRIEEAVSLFREGARLNPQDARCASRYLYAMHFDPSLDAAQIHAEHSAWGRVFETAIAARTGHDNDRSPTRRLRVGYVSPNLHAHVIGLYLRPLLKKLDRTQFQIHCYSDTARPDIVTQDLRQHTDVWRDTAGLTDAALADLVSQDQIDLLVDLVMHMDGGRPGLFARKPAPVQIAWMAYPGSTGLTRMDYRFTDAVLDPPGATDSPYSEQSIRLESFWCFEPPSDGPQVGPLPAEQNGHVSFGCLNTFTKINAGVLDLWREVLAAVPDSRLLFMPPSEKAKVWALEKLQVDPARFDCLPRETRNGYLGYYNRIDLVLDPYPYTGQSTTLDGLWMGAPVVSLAGPTAASRGSLSILTNIGLADLAVNSKSDYVALAVALAKDLPRLRELRAGLRERLAASVLMDTDRFARRTESAYRELWQRWCGTAGAG